MDFRNYIILMMALCLFVSLSINYVLCIKKAVDEDDEEPSNWDTIPEEEQIDEDEEEVVVPIKKARKSRAKAKRKKAA
jgi:hypothetical protein